MADNSTLYAHCCQDLVVFLANFWGLNKMARQQLVVIQIRNRIWETSWICIRNKDPYPEDNNRRKWAKKCRNFQEIFYLKKKIIFRKLEYEKSLFKTIFTAWIRISLFNDVCDPHKWGCRHQNGETQCVKKRLINTAKKSIPGYNLLPFFGRGDLFDHFGIFFGRIFMLLATLMGAL